MRPFKDKEKSETAWDAVYIDAPSKHASQNETIVE